jgi:aconitate hydratase
MSLASLGGRATLALSAGSVTYYRLAELERSGLTRLDHLPFSIRILLEAALRRLNGREVVEQDVLALAGWQPRDLSRPNVPFQPARIVMQDFTGVPALVDLAAMRAALARSGGDPERINPRVPVDLVVDHSVQVDFFASPDALRRNADLEFHRNRERYQFLRWAQRSFSRFRVVPPATGIVHQVNLEYLAGVVLTESADGEIVAFPDTLVGTDSHTTMINGLGVLGWGVGGIEAEAAMLGRPLVFPAPEVVGFRLTGTLAEGTTATDLTLTVTQILRQRGVVGKFVEFFGPGLSGMPLPDRATVANMAPEYGATVGFFPVDNETLRYLQLTGRDPDLIDLVERYCKEQGLYRTDNTPEPSYTEVLELDLSTVEPSLAGPKRPQDRVTLSAAQASFRGALTAPASSGGFALDDPQLRQSAVVGTNGARSELRHGAVVIAAITSCTNTSNPSVMMAAGLLARNAVTRGLQVQPYVKTSLAPGSRVVTEYLAASGLLEPLAALGFNVVGYGCTTCIGNSGPLSTEVVKGILDADLVVSAVLSGNRNFEGRINPHVRANYLASPPLVVAYALAGTMDIDLTTQPLGHDPSGRSVYLREIWPSPSEIADRIARWVGPDLFRQRYADVFTGNETWNAIPVATGALYPWDAASAYIQEPPFFQELQPEPTPPADIHGARALAWLGDSVTTDHISPAGAIPADSPGGQYLIEHGVQPRDFNSYGSRRGNDRVMVRGTFGNIRLRNRLVPGVEGGVTIHLPDGEPMSIYAASQRYRAEGVPLIILAGKEYGTGSSRDWAAKGTSLLGVRSVIAESFERIHRSNLVGMGVLPVEFLKDQGVAPLGLDGKEVFSIQGLAQGLAPGSTVQVRAERPDGSYVAFEARARIDTPDELEYYRHGGVLQAVLRGMLSQGQTRS